MLLEIISISVLGLIFGSFISAITWRIPRNLSFVKGRSCCPNCRRQISWYDNIPLLSYIILGGRCRHCNNKISPRYPIIEIITSIGFLFIYLFLTLKGTTFQGVPDIAKLLFCLTLFVILFSILIIDLEHQIIPDGLVLTGSIIVFMCFVITGDGQLFNKLLAGFLASLFLLLIHIFTRGRGMGLGDVKFAVLGGMIIGLKYIPLWLLLAFLTGAIAGIILILINKAKIKSQIAFGPFLIVSIGITLVFGDKIALLIGLI